MAVPHAPPALHRRSCWSTSHGTKICDQTLYGAAIGAEIVRRGGPGLAAR